MEDLANSNDDKKKQCTMTDNDLCYVCNMRLCFMHSKIVGEVCKIVEEVCKFEDFSRWLIIINVLTIQFRRLVLIKFILCMLNK